MTKMTDKKIHDDPVLTAAYEQGKTARGARIGKTEAPYGDGPERDAWTKGYEDAEKNNG